VLSLWKEREPTYRRRRRLVMNDHDGVVPAFAEVSLGDEAEADAAESAERSGGGLRGRLKRRGGEKPEQARPGPELGGEAEERSTGDEDGGTGAEDAAADPTPEPPARAQPNTPSPPAVDGAGTPAATRAERLARRRARGVSTTAAPPPDDRATPPGGAEPQRDGDPASGKKKRNGSRRKGHGRR